MTQNQEKKKKKKQIALTVWVGIIQSVQGLSRTKKKAKEGGNFLFSFLDCCLNWAVGLLLPLDWDLHPWLAWFSGLWTQAGITSLAFLGLQLIDGASWDLSAVTIALARSS